MENKMNQELITAVETIKTAILRSQYQAAKETTRVQLILYYGIGRYLSSKKGKKTWGTSVLETIRTIAPASLARKAVEMFDDIKKLM